MVQWQLCTVEHLMNSGFGRPFPRHGLQLLFWFSNHCVTCELINFVVIMKLVSDCQPEKGFYGFHLFGNIEELLPVLERRSKRKKQVAYFEIGNLNTKTYPGAANLPTYVTENYGLDGNRGNYNIDRIIISYQVRTRVVETVYVTEHDGEASWRFSPDRTFEISCELIRALQSPQLDLTTFLIQVGYYSGNQVIQDNYIGESHNPEPSAQQMFNTVQTYSGSTARTAQSGDLRFFSAAFNQQLGVNVEPFSYDQQRHYIVNVHNYSGLQHTYWTPETIKGSVASWKSYLSSGWEQFYEGFNKGVKKRSGGRGISFIKILLGAGALYLAAKCFSWLRSWGEGDINEKVVKRIPWRAPRYRHTHIMLDYVY
ncbi:uncharacterized protein LOC118327581 [Morone saxatilis]|uniref:uncharacterized protein LOC118327581 n=1 Tax=Morone saxatilis TaxID=34816 RepID=UPI0015E1DC4A|nr:uncharacterized protein LOC118327581 [Morone saxatilis]